MERIFHKNLLFLVLAIYIPGSCASHFRGAVITWRPGSSQRQIIVDYRISWRMTYSSAFVCNDSNIQTGATLVGEGNLACFNSCLGGNFGPMHYQCTDYSLQEDWSSGWGRQHITLAPSSSLYYEFGFTGGNWIALNIGGNGNWLLRVKADLNFRTDNGKINSSPTTDVAPIFRLQHGCTHSIVLPVYDTDGDVIKCRWAVGSSECASVCGGFPGYLISDACTITYNATGMLGWYAVAVQIEDFMTVDATSPLSSIPAQFLVNVYQSSQSCNRHAEFVDPTPPDLARICVPVGEVFQAEIVARVANANQSISEIKTTSPLGMTKSPVMKVSSTDWKINVTWSPQNNVDVNNVFCFTAVESGSLYESKRRCITLVGHDPPNFIQSSQSPRSLISPYTRQWSISVDKEFVRSSNHSYIRVYNSNGTLEERIDASDPQRVILDLNRRQLQFTTTINLTENEEYYVLFDSGVVKGTANCGLDSVAVTDPQFWRVKIQTPMRLVNGPSELAGRLEVYYSGFWRTVCGDNFYDADAKVVCRMIRNNSDSNVISGRVFYNAYYGSGSGYVLSTNLICVGSEVDISQCSSSSSSGLQSNSSCSHSKDVGLDCRTIVRLMNGSNSYSGRVEVNVNGTWGTVCDDDFDELDGLVICKINVEVHGNAYYGPGYGPITIDQLSCNGYENDISECKSDPWYHHDCRHSEDASVNCQASYMYNSSLTRPVTSWWLTRTETTTEGHPTIRLVNGSSTYSGRVEVYYGGSWGTVCDDDFDHDDVMVICRMLGMYWGSNYGMPYPSAHFGQGSGYIVWDNLRCYGYESELSQCGSNGLRQNNCGHHEDAGVDCHEHYYETSTEYYRTTHSPTTDYWMTYHQSTANYMTTYPWWLSTSGYNIESTISVSCNEFGWDISIDIYRLRQIYPGAIASDIYLGENTCSGVYNGWSLTFQQGLRECLTSERVSNNVLIYTNELVYAQHDPIHPFIILHYNWTVGVECDVQRNETSSGHLHHDSGSNNEHYVTGSSHFTVNMTFYQDGNYLYAIPGNPAHVQVGTQLYVKVFTTASDWTIKMKIHTCYTKPTPSSPDHLNFYIIKNGCEVDSNTHIISQSSHETRFVFTDFEYTTNHEGIYIYCDATFCGSSDFSRQCIQTCNPVIKRRVVIRTESAVESATVETPAETTVDGSGSVTEH